jgi:hypothetical protein
MRKFIKKTIAGSALVLAGATAFSQTAAAPNDSGFQFTGAGTISCKDFLAQTNNPQVTVQFTQWLLGYFAAFNAYSAPAQRIAMPQSSALDAFVLEVCKSNPDVRIIGVANAALQQLGAKLPNIR